jgi:hypothetical protein
MGFLDLDAPAAPTVVDADILTVAPDGRRRHSDAAAGDRRRRPGRPTGHLIQDRVRPSKATVGGLSEASRV